MKRNVHAGRRRSGGLRLEVFTDDELQDIHLATLEVLERTGVFVGDDDALALFESGGCHVDRATGVVKIPPYVVEEAVRSAPSKFVVCGRDPAKDYVMEANRVGFTNFGEGVQVVDPYSGALRVPTKQDVANTAKMVDALHDIDVYERAVSAEDMPGESVPMHQFEAWVTNTAKPGFMGPMNGFILERIVEMASAVSGGLTKLRERPLVTFVTCPVSPLKLIKEFCEIVMGAAKAGLGRQHPLHGDGGRLVAGDARRDAGDAQCRGALGTDPRPAHAARHPGRVRLVDDGHGPAPGGGLGRLARVRPHQRRRRPARALLPAPQLGGRCVG